MSQKEAEKRVKRNRQRIGSITQAAILKQNEWNTDEFVRDFNTIRGRLEGEEQWIRGFVKRLDNSQITGNSAYTRRVQDLAFSEFGKLLDNEFGVNQLERQLPNNLQALKLNSNGKEKF
ncbi:hypothetical protein QO179_24685 [Bacillus stercoris]|nr:hypothetical protein [Bacillus stercoris]